MYVPRAMYSLRESFCRNIRVLLMFTPAFSKAAMYIAAIIGPMAFAVVLIWRTFSRGIPSNSCSMSASEPMCTPPTPTSPAANGLSAS